MPLLSHQLFSFSVSSVIYHYYHTICTIKSLASRERDECTIEDPLAFIINRTIASE